MPGSPDQWGLCYSATKTKCLYFILNVFQHFQTFPKKGQAHDNDYVKNSNISSNAKRFHGDLKKWIQEGWIWPQFVSTRIHACTRRHYICKCIFRFLTRQQSVWVVDISLNMNVRLTNQLPLESTETWFTQLTAPLPTPEGWKNLKKEKKVINKHSHTMNGQWKWNKKVDTQKENNKWQLKRQSSPNCQAGRETEALNLTHTTILKVISIHKSELAEECLYMLFLLRHLTKTHTQKKTIRRNWSTVTVFFFFSCWAHYLNWEMYSTVNAALGKYQVKWVSFKVLPYMMFVNQQT